MGARRQTFGKVSIRLIFGERNRTQIPEKYAMLTHTHTRTRAHILRKHSSLIIRIRWRAQNNPNCNWHPPAYVGKSAYTHHPSLAHTHTHRGLDDVCTINERRSFAKMDFHSTWSPLGPEWRPMQPNRAHMEACVMVT